MMRVEAYTDNQQTNILEGLIYDAIVLAKISDLWKDGLEFGCQEATTLAKLCLGYWKAHGNPPGEDVVINLVEEWASQQASEASAKLMESLVSGVIRKHSSNGSLNSPYVIDLAGDYFSKMKLKKALAKASAYQEQGKIKEAFECFSSARPIEMGKEDTGSFYYNNLKGLLGRLNREQDELLVTYKGNYLKDLNSLFGNLLKKDSFVSFVAPEGVGKTWWLIDLAHRAVLNRKKTIFFEVGDMSRRQIEDRFSIRMLGRPLTNKKITRPTSCTYDNKENGIKIGFEEEDMPGLDSLYIKTKYKEFIENRIKSVEPYFRLDTYSACSINVAGIKSKIDSLHREFNFWPEVIVIDYADILAPPDGSTRWNIRDQINETWMQLRKLSTDNHALVATATQANRQAYSAKIIKMEHMSEEKRKLSHVSGMVAISAGREEKEMGAFKLNVLKAREMAFQPNRILNVASCLDLGLPAVLATWGNEIKLISKSKENSDKRGGG